MCSDIIQGMSENQTHWADIYADKIIREKGDKELYTCASGITPSGTVHIGNFREIISVELVVRALRAKGKNVRFIYSWDDYDVFRKVPKNMPQSFSRHISESPSRLSPILRVRRRTMQERTSLMLRRSCRPLASGPSIFIRLRDTEAACMPKE